MLSRRSAFFGIIKIKEGVNVKKVDELFHFFVAPILTVIEIMSSSQQNRKDIILQQDSTNFTDTNIFKPNVGLATKIAAKLCVHCTN